MTLSILQPRVSRRVSPLIGFPCVVMGTTGKQLISIWRGSVCGQAPRWLTGRVKTETTNKSSLYYTFLMPLSQFENSPLCRDPIQCLLYSHSLVAAVTFEIFQVLSHGHQVCLLYQGLCRYEAKTITCKRFDTHFLKLL